MVMPWLWITIFDLAIEYYEDALALAPDDNGLVFNIACCKLIRLQQEHTGQLTAEALNTRPSPEAIKSLVINLESLLEAAQNSDDSESAASNYVHALIAVHQLADDYASALDAIQRWAPGAPSEALQLAMALVYVHLNKVPEAESILSQYFERDGQNFDVCRFELAIAKGKLTEALEILERLERSQKTETMRIMTLSKRSMILNRLGRVTEAVNVIDQLIERYGAIEIAVIEAAVLYKLTDQNLKHEQLISSRSISKEGFMSIHRAISDSYCEQGKWLLAAFELRKMPEIDDSELGLLMLITVQQKAGLNHAAGCTARKVRLLRGNVEDGALAQIELDDYYQRGDFSSAVELLALLRASAPNNTDYVCFEAIIQFQKLKNKSVANALLAAIKRDDISGYWRSELQRCGLISES